MKFSTREDIEAPIEYVFASVTDFDGFERQALCRGADVSREDTLGKPGLGSTWAIRFPFRGKTRDIEARVTEFEAPEKCHLDTRLEGLDGLLTVDLIQLSPARTRLQLALDLSPRSLSARLLVQSLKFARSNLNKRFGGRVWKFAQDVEGRYRGPV